MLNFNFDFNLFNNNYYLYERLLVLLFSLVPAILLVIFILYTDRKSKEPAKNIVLCLLSGILTIALAKYFETLVMPHISNNILLTYAWAAIEELSKMAIFFLFLFDNKYFDDIYDGIVYMSLIALSFAGLENIMYAFSESTVASSISLALMRDFTTIPLHVICGVVIGSYLSRASFSKDKFHKYYNIILATIIATLIHGSFNNAMTLLSSMNVSGGGSIQVFLFMVLPLVIIMVVLSAIAFKYINRTVKLNDVYITNDTYDKRYSYLMTYREFLTSADMLNRKKRYNKLRGIKPGEEKSKVDNAIDDVIGNVAFSAKNINDSLGDK